MYLDKQEIHKIIKEKIKDQITHDIEEYVNEKECLRKKVLESNSPPEILVLLEEIYGNKQPQMELALELIQSYYEDTMFKNKFFDVNYSGFENDDKSIKIGFASFAVKEILIKNLKFHTIDTYDFDYHKDYILDKIDDLNVEKEFLREQSFSKYINHVKLCKNRCLHNNIINKVRYIINRKEIIQECRDKILEIENDIAYSKNNLKNIINKIEIQNNINERFIKDIDESKMIQDFANHNYQIKFLYSAEDTPGYFNDIKEQQKKITEKYAEILKYLKEI